ncbi:unnamed protein product [Prorocentrum cordatum]|uniref:Phospholipase B-like n=1 Tax=Prorocentrum cordatum TaxID=2364126 RepID=A0ABN9T5N4_9DINO|nr:unnamed protein product [Polarella glacialis]
MGRGRPGAAAAALLAAAVGGRPAAAQGHWIVQHFTELMNCRMFSVGSALRDILLPYGVADPVAALFCPLGTSAALHQMAALCLELLGARCVQRALRLLHLAKLFMLFNFNDYGAWFQHSRWQTDMSRLSSEAQELAKLAKAEAGPGAAVAVLPPVAFRDETWRIGLVSYCNYNDSQSPEASMLIAEDGMMLNSGSFLLRNNEWSSDFLTRTVDLLSAPMPQSFQHMPWHEQAPLMYLSLVPGVLAGLAGPEGGPPEGDGPLAAGYDPRVALLRQRALNSYPPELVRRTEHALPHEAYEEGDLAMYSRYCQASLERLRASGTAS